MRTTLIPEETKQACRLYESILSAVALAEMYSKNVKEIVAVEVEHLLSFEDPQQSATKVFEAYLRLLKE